MTIRVKFFAILRDHAGVGELPLDLPDDATVAAAMAELSERFPAIRAALGRAAAAVNLTRAAADTILHHDDELALLPPVSGG